MLAIRLAQIRRGLVRKVIIIVVLISITTVLVFNHRQYKIGLFGRNSTADEFINSRYQDQPPDNRFNSSSEYYGQPKETKPCDTIHLALICGGFNSTRNFYVLLKSILFYRTDKIHLHLFVNDVSHMILNQLFQTWIVPDLVVEFYNMSEYEHEISWITSQHYSHHFGLMKLVFLSALSERRKLSKAIIVDTDMLAIGNIRQLWDEFGGLECISGRDKPVFGMVENQSDWYLGNNQLSGSRKVWPAIGRGFNSGLILANLVELERQNWQQIWRRVAELELTSHLTTTLADQDIFNAVIRLHNAMVYELPCYYNLQLNDHTKLDEVCPEKGDFQLIHWNSPHKFLTKNSKADYYKNWYLTFRNWDGKLLEQGASGNIDKIVSKNYTSVTLSPSNLDIVCGELRPRPHQKLRTFLYFLDFEVERVDYDVTLVVHLSLDRLQVLDQLAFQWQGPVSVAIYLSELETNLLLVSIQNSRNLLRRRNIGYHLVFRDYGFNYPINRLRNIALNNAITPYVFLSDIDFLPSTNLHEYLKRSIADMATKQSADPLAKRALIVPAFENLQYKFDFPTSKADLLKQLDLGSVSMFRDQIWPKGHAPTDYARWRVSTKLYRVKWRPEYEPFVVTSRNVTRFDERFVGFGWNKVENIMQLAALGYEFLVLPEAFVIHKFHSASYDIIKHRESHRYRSCTKHLRRLFLMELKVNYPDFFMAASATN